MVEAPVVTGTVATVPKSAGICVVIAAYNAADTIGRAVRSALDQPEVSEIRVVDDASSDATAAVAFACDDGTGRLAVRRLATNAGPSAARNIAIDDSSAPYVAVLDADDFFLPGRFAALLAIPDWDLVADNIAFVDEAALVTLDRTAVAAHRAAPATLAPAAFVEACITKPGRYKGELGFLKPVMARTFLDRHALRYAETMRLSEDYDLYVRALMAGARFRLAAVCGYVAVERAGSLSGTHTLRDLDAVETAVARLLAMAPADDLTLRAALAKHHVQMRRKRRHRALLARKHDAGLVRALRDTARTPGDLAGLVVDIARDKLAAVRTALLGAPVKPAARFLR